jgi:hypothetical protein
MMMNRSNEALLQFDEKQEARVHLEITWEALRILESTGLFDIQDCYVALGIVTTEELFALARDRVVQRLSSTRRVSGLRPSSRIASLNRKGECDGKDR